MSNMRKIINPIVKRKSDKHLTITWAVREVRKPSDCALSILLDHALSVCRLGTFSLITVVLTHLFRYLVTRANLAFLFHSFPSGGGLAARTLSGRDATEEPPWTSSPRVLAASLPPLLFLVFGSIHIFRRLQPHGVDNAKRARQQNSKSKRNTT